MQFPKKCPYCGKDIVANVIDTATDKEEHLVEIHKCIHCSNSIFVIKEISLNSFKEQIINYYPTVNTVDFPARIKELSPKTYKTYEQAIKANENGYDMLVGAGLRIALEWLVWDYLIKVKGYSISEIEGLTLHHRIEKIKGNFYTDVCTNLVRSFGNDSVHIIKQIDFSTNEVIDIFKLLCKLIDSELQIIEVNKRLTSKT